MRLDIVPNEYVSVPSEEFLAYAQRQTPDGYVSVSVFAHVFFNPGPRVGVALYVAHPRFVEEEPVFAYVSLASPYISRAAARWCKTGVCSPRTTWVKICRVHGCPAAAAPFADSVKLVDHCIPAATAYSASARPTVRFIERVALQDPDFGVFGEL